MCFYLLFVAITVFLLFIVRNAVRNTSACAPLLIAPQQSAVNTDPSQASMLSGIQALAAAAAATQKITVAPQTSQIKIGDYHFFKKKKEFPSVSQL